MKEGSLAALSLLRGFLNSLDSGSEGCAALAGCEAAGVAAGLGGVARSEFVAWLVYTWETVPEQLLYM